MKIQTLNPEHLAQFKRDMQEAFQQGAVEGGFCQKGGKQILPESHIDHSLSTDGAVAYEAVIEGENVGGEGGREEIVGGAIVVINRETHHGHLDFLYVKHGTQGKGIGQAIWRHIETSYPEVSLWETCTPYFDRRNIHFYINRLGFHAVEFFWHFHPDPNDPMSADLPENDYFDGMFRFEKKLMQ